MSQERKEYGPLVETPAEYQDVSEDHPLYFMVKQGWVIEKLEQVQSKSVLDANPTWKAYPDESHVENKRLKWTCPNCDHVFTRKVRDSVVRCGKCYRLMQDVEHDYDPDDPDRENPDWYLRTLAERQGKDEDEYVEEQTDILDFSLD